MFRKQINGENMKTEQTLDGIVFARMINSGAENLKKHAEEINNLNVFPIPDGDTGDNMLLTMMGGVYSDENACEKLSDVAKRVSGGMLLAARGNSGVILSQFFEGIKNGFEGLDSAQVTEIEKAFKQGVEQAYKAVMTPTEGTILTVVREATEYACGCNTKTPEEFLNAFISEAKMSLARTPELLPVLKKAGVVDSGAAGLIYILDGMLKGINGKVQLDQSYVTENSGELDFDAFDEDSVLEFGYCTELLVRLQNAKCDIASFDLKVITDYLKTVGDSIVTVRNGSIIKIHVHTMTPEKVLQFCRVYGEFLKVKIENMSLQHNNTAFYSEQPKKEKKKFGIVTVLSGEGLKQFFAERGADVVIDGGQSMNPSTEDFLKAFEKANAETIFVLPNNSNIILAAKQAADLYKKSEVRVIESKTIGDGYAALSMFDESSGDVDTITECLNEAMKGVITAEISHCVRDAEIDGAQMHTGDYIGFKGKQLLAVNGNRMAALMQSIVELEFSNYDICILIYGKDVSEDEAFFAEKQLKSLYPYKEIYTYGGMQSVYDYILILE